MKALIFSLFFSIFLISCTPKVIIQQVPLETIKEIYIEQKIDTVIIKENCYQEPEKINVTVYFSFDSYELNQEAKRILDGIKEKATGPLLLTGYGCLVGNRHV